MKVGIITEGSAERTSLIEIVKELRKKGLEILNPIFAPIEPKATPMQIAKSAESAISILLNKKGCDRVVLILDYENHQDCIIERKTKLEEAIKMIGHPNVFVVVKVRQYENWLLADLDAIGKCKNFTVTQAIRRKVEPGNADSIHKPVVELTKLKNNKKSFHKNLDTLAIAKQFDPEKAGLHSRSFRRFLKLIGHPDYKDQLSSKRITE